FHFTILAQVAPDIDPACAGQDSLRNKRALIVDDNATNRRILTRQLARWGMAAVAVESGALALEQLESGAQFDVAILDMQMPGMDGMAVARQLRRFRGESLPLVMLTSIDVG